MTHQELSALVGTWGLILFCVLFAIALAYALWPSNRKTFEHMAQLPLNEDHEGGAQ